MCRAAEYILLNDAMQRVRPCACACACEVHGHHCASASIRRTSSRPSIAASVRLNAHQHSQAHKSAAYGALSKSWEQNHCMNPNKQRTYAIFIQKICHDRGYDATRLFIKQMYVDKVMGQVRSFSKLSLKRSFNYSIFSKSRTYLIWKYYFRKIKWSENN